MTLRVRGVPPLLVESGDNIIRAALPVRGLGQWNAMAEAANWCGGVGGAIAFFGTDSAESSSSFTKRAWTWPRSQHLTWVWTVALRATGAQGARGIITLTPGGDEHAYFLSDDTLRVFQFTQDHASVTEGEVTIEVDNDTLGTVAMLGGCVNEVKRGYLDSASASVGVRETSCTKGQAIYENTTIDDKYSAQAVWEQIRDAKTNARRQKMLDCEVATVTVTTTAFPGTSNILAIDPAIQARNMTSGGGTTGTVKFNVRAAMVGAGSGEVRATMSTGGTALITVTSTVMGWHTAVDLTIESDDLSQSNHIRGGSRDTVLLEMRMISGTAVQFTNVSIGEGPGGV